MSEIQTNKGIPVVVDDDMLPELSQYCWCFNNYGYAQGCVNGKIVYMHRLITGAKKGQMVDHINNIKTDNRRENLRIVSGSTNCQRRRTKPGASGYRGVQQVKNRFAARITHEYQACNLGRFDTAEEAARAYDTAAKKLYGKHAYLNFPSP